jgi:hypothetical protein
MEFKDWFDIAFKIAGIAGGLIAAFKAIAEMRLNRIVRERDLRWKQAGSAKQLIDEMFDGPKAKDASLMLDWEERDYEIDGQVVTIYTKDIISALSITDLNFSNTETYIRDCFDYFFYYIQSIEQSLVNHIFLEKAIKFPLEYYARIIRDGNVNKPLRKFLEKYHYTESVAFFQRFNTWT